MSTVFVPEFDKDNHYINLAHVVTIGRRRTSGRAGAEHVYVLRDAHGNELGITWDDPADAALPVVPAQPGFLTLHYWHDDKTGEDGVSTDIVIAWRIGPRWNIPVAVDADSFGDDDDSAIERPDGAVVVLCLQTFANREAWLAHVRAERKEARERKACAGAAA